MDGKIIAFNDETQQGTIVASDGQQYAFSFADWRGRGLPGPGIPVRFDMRDFQAVHVLNLPEKQQRASSRVAASAPNAERDSLVPAPRYSSWALGAIMTVMLGLFFDVLAPAIGLLAAVLALLGLRQIHHEPRRYKGRLFCWAAIALALIIATLSLFLDPLPDVHESRASVVSDIGYTG